MSQNQAIALLSEVKFDWVRRLREVWLDDRWLSALRVLDRGEHRFVPLAELRQVLPDLARPIFDATALALQQQGLIALFRIDEPWRRSESDEAAAINVAGNHYHSAYLKG